MRSELAGRRIHPSTWLRGSRAGICERGKWNLPGCSASCSGVAACVTTHASKAAKTNAERSKESEDRCRGENDGRRRGNEQINDQERV